MTLRLKISKNRVKAVYLGFLTLVFAAYLIYQFEKDHNPGFENFADALWWGMTSFTTIGYGDRFPKSCEGKIFTSLFALFGISFFALPAGILGTGFALKAGVGNHFLYLPLKELMGLEILKPPEVKY